MTDQSTVASASASASNSSPTKKSEEISLAEENRVWKKNAPFLYDLLMQKSLSWPSLTCQWFPDKTQLDGKNYSTQRLLLGTHTDSQEPNALLIAEMRIPSPETEIDARMFGVEEHIDTDEITLQQVKNSAASDKKLLTTATGEDDSEAQSGGYSGHSQSFKFEVVQRIPHPTEVNRSRYCPHNLNLLATRTAEESCNTLVFDRTQHSSQPTDANDVRPQLRLEGQTAEGYGLSWSLHSAGQLLTCGSDARTCLYDINCRPSVLNDSTSKQQRSAVKGETIQPLRVFDSLHTAEQSINDVIWNHHRSASEFLSCSDDRSIALADIRSSTTSANSSSGLKHRIVDAHTDCVNSLSYNQLSEHLFASGGADKVVKVWDERNLSKAIHSLAGHTAEVTCVAYSPFSSSVLMSAAHDRRVHIWDLSRIGAEQSAEDAEDGPPELLFIHGGHTDAIGECSWSPTEDWALVSVADDNVVHVWQMAENIYNDAIQDEPMTEATVEQTTTVTENKQTTAQPLVSSTQQPTQATSNATSKPATSQVNSILKPSSVANGATNSNQTPAPIQTPIQPANPLKRRRPQDSPDRPESSDVTVE